MRLLNVSSLELTEFHDPDVPKYVVASHRWLGDEASYEDFQTGRHLDSSRTTKIQQFCEVVRRIDPPVHWLWVDTCCINKESSTEMWEAINSMYVWYSQAYLCLAYLHDVDDTFYTQGPQSLIPRGIEDQLLRSIWFKRGWTLQELLAPAKVVFLSHGWKVIGHKCHIACQCLKYNTIEGLDLNFIISKATGIPDHFLRRVRNIKDASVEQRLTWASKRKTTYVEDMAYCLLGIFGVNMDIMYGEGARAAQRFKAVVKQMYEVGERTNAMMRRPALLDEVDARVHSLLHRTRLDETEKDHFSSWISSYTMPLVSSPFRGLPTAKSSSVEDQSWPDDATRGMWIWLDALKDVHDINTLKRLVNEEVDMQFAELNCRKLEKREAVKFGVPDELLVVVVMTCTGQYGSDVQSSRKAGCAWNVANMSTFNTFSANPAAHRAKRHGDDDDDRDAPDDKRHKTTGSKGVGLRAGGLPCIFHVGDPENWGNHTKRYQHISELLRHLKSHGFYACGKCLTRFSNPELMKQHACIRSCASGTCKRHHLYELEMPEACAHIDTFGQWKALYRLEFPDGELPDITKLGEGSRANKGAPGSSSEPWELGSIFSGPAFSVDQSSAMNTNNDMDHSNFWENPDWAANLASTAIEEPLKPSAEGELQKLQQKIHLLEERVSRPSGQVQGLQIALRYVWKALENARSKECQPGSELCQLVNYLAPNVLNIDSTADDTSDATNTAPVPDAVFTWDELEVNKPCHKGPNTQGESGYHSMHK